MVREPAYAHTLDHHHPVVAFEAVRAPAGNLVGEEGDGMSYSYEWFRFGRFMVAARCVGAAGRVLDEATAFATRRTVGEPDHRAPAGRADRKRPRRATRNATRDAAW